MIYLRFVSKSGLIKTSLPTSKAKVLSCISTMTIPRADINSVLLMGVESENICLCLQSVYPISNFYFWTDSSIFLCWINNTKTVYKRYVQYRLIRIRELIDGGNLLLVPSKMNPADIATGGLNPLQLVGNMFWGHGPEFLTLPKTSWPQLHVGNNVNSCYISGISNKGMLFISSNIDDIVNKN